LYRCNFFFYIKHYDIAAVCFAIESIWKIILFIDQVCAICTLPCIYIHHKHIYNLMAYFTHKLCRTLCAPRPDNGQGEVNRFPGCILILLYRSCPVMSTSCTKTWSADHGGGDSEETISRAGHIPHRYWPSSSGRTGLTATQNIMYVYNIVIYNRRFPRNDQWSEFFIMGKCTIIAVTSGRGVCHRRR